MNRPDWVFQMQVGLLVKGVKGLLNPEVKRAGELRKTGFVVHYRIVDSVPTATAVITPHMAASHDN